MICPKCQNMMRTVDKSGVHIEQCDGCRGIFLDRGELEQIAGAESAFYRQQPPPYGAPHGRPDSPRPYQGGYSDSPRPYRGGHGDSPRPYRGGHADSPRPYRGGYGDSPRPYGGRRKRSFLENLFD
ncbi:zf-TFIIB domain-containing protein [Amycolatopsis sp. WGS_07]|uniref:TFIIB-type zinc ribbon-containing protein n=1 Tax=Amycolatopsis sp. WGS_07 TaxID=3076764 RepID=UPI003872F614